jgi:hypothetical protein
MLSLLSQFAIQAQRSIPPQSTARVISVGALVVGRKLLSNPVGRNNFLMTGMSCARSNDTFATHRWHFFTHSLDHRQHFLRKWIEGCSFQNMCRSKNGPTLKCIREVERMPKRPDDTSNKSVKCTDEKCKRHKSSLM